MFFKMAADKYKSDWDKVPFYADFDAHLLGSKVYDTYSDEKISKIIAACDFHKLTYKLKQTPSENSVYKYLIKSV